MYQINKLVLYQHLEQQQEGGDEYELPLSGPHYSTSLLKAAHTHTRHPD